MATSPLATTLARDGNKEVIQVAQTLQFSDGTGTPQQSPEAAVPTTGTAFVVPAGALCMVYQADAATYVNAAATLDGDNGYHKVAANTDFCFPCAGLAGSSIRIAAVTGTVTVYFYFEMGA